MSTSYSMTPFEPSYENLSRLEELQESIDLRIDPVIYEQRLLERWPLAEAFESFTDSPVCYFLNYRSPDGIKWRGEDIQLHADLQVVTVSGAPSPEFVHWHRSLVPSRYRLYLSCDAYGDEYDEILPGATLEEISRMIGAPVDDPQMIFHITTASEWHEHIGLRLEKSDAWRTYRSAALEANGHIQCAGAQQIRALANALHRGQHGLVLMWLHAEHITSPIEYVELPGISSPGETFPRIAGSLDGMAIGRVVPYEPDPDGTFPWPVDIADVS